jgi:hypothetical protein
MSAEDNVMELDDREAPDMPSHPEKDENGPSPCMIAVAPVPVQPRERQPGTKRFATDDSCALLRAKPKQSMLARHNRNDSDLLTSSPGPSGPSGAPRGS